MNTVELLSPAKNLETAIAAINSGADAIYIGASGFGARQKASNTLESIEKLVNYAHKFYVRVHVTINTILNNSELDEAIKLVENLYNIGVDAIIIQDMGLLKAAIDGKLPPIQIHMSTQCNNRTLEQAKFFDGMGVSRVILARELSLKQIENICKNTSCEIETFIHGALCVSYSGQCYMSYANGGRSANRGECAQPCRRKYSLVDGNGKVILRDKYLLSLKDFNSSENIEKLINCGINSFKIEGRLKDINYVKNVTAYYNELLNKYAKRASSGKVFLDFKPNIYKTFNRKYTSYFLNRREECYNFLSPKSMGEKVGTVKKVFVNGFETDAKLNNQDGLCCIIGGELCGFLVNKVEGNRVYPNKMPNIKAGAVLYRNFDFEFDKTLKVSKTVRKVGVSFFLRDNNLIVSDEDSNSITLRLPIGEEAKNPQKLRDTYIKQLNKTGESDFYTQKVVIEQNILPFLPVSEINEIRREALHLLMKERINNYPKLVQNPIGYLPYWQSQVDYCANIFNDEAELFYKNSCCEVKEKALETQQNIPSGTELMRTKHCLRYAADLCSKNNKKVKNLYLVDENGKKYPLEFDCKNCEMVVLNP